MLHIVQSNRLDSLADALLERWSGTETADGLPAREVVIVPSRGVERWLTHRIADRFGVCAGVEFRFAAAFIWDVFARALPAVSEKSPFDSDVTTLRLFAALGRLPDDDAHAPLAAYVSRTDPIRRLELARRIAQVFSQYMVYRPDWLEQWAAGRKLTLGPDEEWQRQLWQALLKSMGPVNVQHPKEEFFAALANKGSGQILPPRVRVFALPAVPPLYAEVLARLARHVDVEWYSLNPCRQFWADIATEKARARREQQGDPAAALTDIGHPLLASWGRQRREQLRLLAARIGDENAQDQDHYAEPAAATLLGRLQTSLLDLADLEGTVAGDTSLQIHECHSLTRQVEVVHDALLALFDAKPHLQASDVAIFVPDVDAAAPIIDAVFGAAPRDRHIPYAITGRARPDGTPLLQAAEFLMGLPGSRFEVASVLGFLEIPAVLRRYRIDATDLDLIQRWLRDAGARWGLDAAHRARLGLPAESRHTWAEALQRLLIGYALPSRTAGLAAGVLPYGELEGSQAHTLGKLGQLVADLADAATRFGQPRRLQEWSATLGATLNATTRPTPDDFRDDARLRAAIASLAADAGAAGCDEKVDVAVVRALLRARLAASAPGALGTGRVTFCGIGPLRGVPYRVIGLLGLDAEAFPRNPPRAEFDLLAAAPRAGDPVRRDDDRGAFLDALAGAGEVLILGYTGHSIRDNAPLPPSVLIAELLDYLARFAGGDRSAVEQALVTAHPLQPFNRAYFEQGRRASYATELVPAAQSLAAPFDARLPRRELFTQPLPEPAPEDKRVELEELTWFFRHPVSKLLKRLGLRKAAAREEIPADEPFELEQPWDLQRSILAQRLGGTPIDECLARALADPRVPHGQWGRQQLEALAAEADAFAVRVEQARGDPPQPPLPFELSLGEFTLTGVLAPFSADGLFGHSLREDGPHELMDWWLRHLVLCLVRPAGAQLQTRVLLRDGGFRFGPVADPASMLGGLLREYWKGLQQPLPYFPKAAWAFLHAEPDRALDKAHLAWKGTRDFKTGAQQQGESTNGWYKLAYGGELERLPAGFAGCARAVLGPALAARQELA